MTLTKHLEKKTNKKKYWKPWQYFILLCIKLIQLFLSTYANYTIIKIISIYENIEKKNYQNYFFSILLEVIFYYFTTR